MTTREFYLESETDSDSEDFEMNLEEYVKYCINYNPNILCNETEKKEFRDELFRLMRGSSYDGTIRSYFSDTFWSYLQYSQKAKILIIFNNYPEETISKYKTGFLAIYYFSKLVRTAHHMNTLVEKIDNWNNVIGAQPISVEMLRNMTEEEAFAFCDNITI